MPGTTPPTSQLDWLSSTTAIIVLLWSRATRDLLKSFGWGIAALHRLDAATKLPSLAARPIASFGSARDKLRFKALLARRCEHWGLARYLVSDPVAVDALRLQVSRIAILHPRQVALRINDLAHGGVLGVLPVGLTLAAA